jgi:autotransporter-associated beta strand protein
LAGAVLDIAGNISQDTGVTAAVNLNGGGTLILSGSNSFSGGVAVDAGRLVLMHPFVLPDGSSLSIGDPLSFPSPVAGIAVLQQGTVSVPEPSGFVVALAALIAAFAFRRRFRLVATKRFA